MKMGSSMTNPIKNRCLFFLSFLLLITIAKCRSNSHSLKVCASSYYNYDTVYFHAKRLNNINGYFNSTLDSFICKSKRIKTYKESPYFSYGVITCRNDSFSAKSISITFLNDHFLFNPQEIRNNSGFIIYKGVQFVVKCNSTESNWIQNQFQVVKELDSFPILRIYQRGRLILSPTTFLNGNYIISDSSGKLLEISHSIFQNK